MSMKRRKVGSFQATVASDSDSDGDGNGVHDELPRAREEGLFHRSIRTDAHGHTVVSTSSLNVAASPSKRRPPERDLLVSDDVDFSVSMDVDSDVPASAFPFSGEESFAFDEGHPLDPPRRKQRESDHPMAQWLRDRRARFLDELLRLEGRAHKRQQTRCAACPANMTEAIFRCKDCFTDALFCKSCIVAEHKDNPFHRVEVWNDRSFFETTTLKSLGLRIQLGHGRNGICPGTLLKRTLAAAAEEEARKVAEETAQDDGEEGEDGLQATKRPRDDFCVVDSNGVHEVGLDFCSCPSAQDHDIQLFHARLYPATTTNPATAATFRVLRDFQLLSLEAKCSAHHYYNKLARQTNNTGVFQPRTRYHEFRRMAHQWGNLQMLKRAGRGHVDDGIAETRSGECAVLCPACPQPGKNLPLNGSWRNVPREQRFIYALFLALDANFRMKRKDVSSEADDPSLGDGWAFFSKVEEYMRHLDAHWTLEQEKSTCVAHDAVDEPNREAFGTAASGIGTVDCARHNMKRPNGVGDLQKGERYINMDYLLWKSLEYYDDILQLFISYDIVCQWHKNVWIRLAQYNPELRQRGVRRFYTWLIPKFHLPAHIEDCNVLFSFNLTPFVGQTDGEAPERGWAHINGIATSTKEMGPGARRDALDNAFNDWNHKKVIGLGKSLLEKIQRAVPNMASHRLALLEAEQGLAEEVVTQWTAEMEAWELDASQPNPFKLTEKHEGMAAIRLRLASQVAAEGVENDVDDVRGDIHAHEMIHMGMQLEGQQRQLASDAGLLKTHATDRQKTGLVERSNKLGRKISEWLKIRESFTPVVSSLRAADDAARASMARLQPAPPLPVPSIKLWLPSALAAQPQTTVKRTHAYYEFELRVGQAHAALEGLRQQLLVRTAKWHYKDEFQRGVAANTRGKAAIANVDEQIRRIAAEYRVAHQALVRLGPILNETDWKRQLRVLMPDDVRPRPRATFSDPQRKSGYKRKRGQTREQVADERRRKQAEDRPASWIWLSQLSENEEQQDGMTEALRIEWAKTRARAMRWTEEVDLLEEEMRRVLEFQKWKAEWWAALADQRQTVVASDSILNEGLTAYARRQSQIQLDLRARFQGNWRDIPAYIQMGRDSVTTIPEEEEDGGEDEDEEDEDAPIPDAPRDEYLAASLVEESLA
ncbi:CxC2 domain-containing protein [Favolaschia claudopus]|uniref:CxC2 domain-containing protein n=1 Tax=Favolaschia claudopus TaxID=2862362 RepID=A0AAV9ZQT5_9AGAR